MARFAGIDIGTSGAKALVVDEFGVVHSSAGFPYETSRPHADWSEQDPEDWWAATQLALAAIEADRVDSIGLTGQMHGAVFLDASHQVIRPALLWNDQRTTTEVAELESKHGALIRSENLNAPMTGFQLPKILWLRKHEPDSVRRARHILLPKDYVRFKLTGVLATDPTDASGTGLFNVAERQWSSQIIEALGLEPSWFPPVVESTQVSGKTEGGTPVSGGAGDQAAAATGTGCFDPRVSNICLGTSGVVFKPVSDVSGDSTDSVHLFCHTDGSWHKMGVVLSCGGALKWFRDVFSPDASYDQLAAIAETVPVGSRGLTFLPYLTGERCPYIEPMARASFTGVSASHGLPEFARAVFEGATFAIWGAARAVGIDAGTTIRVTGGGAKSDFWMQMLADALGRRCVRMRADEGPAFGAALLGAVAVGAFLSIAQAAQETVHETDEFTPRPGRPDEYAELFARSTRLHDRLAEPLG